jgi:hypothetical protein
MMYIWVARFNSTEQDEFNVASALTKAMFMANDAMLTHSVVDSTYNEVTYLEGASVTKPSVHPASVIVISILMGLDVIAILAVAFISFRANSSLRVIYAARLESRAAAAVGAQLQAGTRIPGPLFDQGGVSDEVRGGRWLQER